MNHYIKYLLVFVVILVACDHGIDPGDIEPPVQGISGTIYYSNWPDQSTLLDLRLIVFKNYPPVNIFHEVTHGNAIVHPQLGSPENLPYEADSTDFIVALAQGTYNYVVIAQQYGPEILEDWRAVGQYDTTLQDTIPTAIIIEKNSLLDGINIVVDFDSLPGQPF